jgi:hypothetical protein
MDQSGIDWYKNEMKDQLNKKTIIIASNLRYEFDFIEDVINLADFKTAQKNERG